LLRFFEVLLDHPNSGAGLIPGRTGQCPVERDLYTVFGNLVKTGKDRSKVLIRFFEVLLDHQSQGNLSNDIRRGQQSPP